MKRRLQTIPVFVFLLPVFFVLHGYEENQGYIHPGEAILLAGVYLAASAIVFGLAWLFYRNTVKSALAAALVLGFYFFFGALQDFLKAHLHWLSRYSVIVSLFLIVAIAWIIILRRTHANLSRLTLYLNVLLLIYIVIDALLLINIHMWVPFVEGTRASRDTIELHYVSGQKPDVYFLVFDAYTSSKALKEQYHYDNGDFDRFLVSKGFHIQADSRANYKYTILSMPSILNMGYLDKLKEVKGGPVAEYYYLSDLIKDNVLTHWFELLRYDIVNCSIFDLSGHPTPVTRSWLPLQTRLITDQTFYSRFYRDVGWNFYQYTVNPFSKKEIDLSLDNDNMLIERLEAASAIHSKRPRFIYGHFNIPHPPYYYDKDGRRREVKAPYRPTDEDNVQEYLDYLTYTNRRAEEIIDTILKNTQGQAVIVLMGDHGLRYHDQLGYNPPSFVENQNAVYFPNRDYHLFYDSISGVNQFRVILNSLFDQQLPLLKDSVVNVKDKK